MAPSEEAEGKRATREQDQGDCKVPVEKVRGELLVETVVNVLMPKVVPALRIG